MKQLCRLACVVAALALLFGCTKTPATVPTQTQGGTTAPTPLPTETLSSAATLSTCPPGSESHVDRENGFSACYPAGWKASAYQDPEKKTQGMDFVSPVPDENTLPKRISVRIAAVGQITDTETVLQNLAMQLMTQRSQQGREIVAIRAFPIDGRKAVEDSLEGTVLVAGKPAAISGWVVGFPTDDRMWYITVSGPGEARAEVENIYRQFLASFRFVPRE